MAEGKEVTCCMMVSGNKIILFSISAYIIQILLPLENGSVSITLVGQYIFGNQEHRLYLKKKTKLNM
jgi:hypothetical protein